MAEAVDGNAHRHARGASAASRAIGKTVTAAKSSTREVIIELRGAAAGKLDDQLALCLSRDIGACDRRGREELPQRSAKAVASRGLPPKQCSVRLVVAPRLEFHTDFPKIHTAASSHSRPVLRVWTTVCRGRQRRKWFRAHKLPCGWSRLISVHMLLYRGLCAPITGDWGAGHRMTARSFEARSTTGAPIDPRTRVLLEGPIAATLVRLAAPNVVVMIVQASVGLIETYFIGWIGTDALAGVALVFPPLMLMQMMRSE